MITLPPRTKADLSAQVVATTGAGSGIGSELAILRAARGASLALYDINEAGLLDTTDAVRSPGRAVRTSWVDISDTKQMAGRCAWNSSRTESEAPRSATVAAQAHIGYTLSRATPPVGRDEARRRHRMSVQ
ncbi:SDR family NAD(P)-dependent oxidoreductase [Nocardia sp. NPDC005998]|uniref:SDR family NAD(P)-dependent oxidoreductase n=1 Tax=Nocardia sp. NPDC005998 TaxID=3156894 RepID=UPI0033BD38F5